MEKSVNLNIEILETTVSKLGDLNNEVVFLGGCATGLFMTDPAAAPIRITLDVDIIVEVATLAKYRRFTQKLRKRGFREDLSPEAPICRWHSGNIILDVMPTDPQVLGFGNRWFTRAFAMAEFYTLPSKRIIKILPTPFFLATKLEAFDNRGNFDFLMSRDLEDVVAILDGRPEIVEEVQSAEQDLKIYLEKRLFELRNTRDFIDALSGYLPPDTISQDRSKKIIERIEAIAGS